MLYHLFQFLDENYRITGASLFQYSTFRASFAFILSLVIATLIGKKIIARLKSKQIVDEVRIPGFPDEERKRNTPTMGGIILIIAILIPILTFAKLNNVYIWLIVFSVIIMGAVGFADDYIKVFKKNKAGIKGRYKIAAQVVLGIVVGSVLYANDNVRVKDFEKVYSYKIEQNGNIDWYHPAKEAPYQGEKKLNVVKDGHYLTHEIKSFKTNVPFLKDNSFDYSNILKPFTKNHVKWGWIIFIPIVIFIITAVSNAANLTDGIDGLASGVSAISMSTLGLFAFVSGNIFLADYLNILYIPNSGEILIACAAVMGACAGFLWYNSFPASVFMGDTGSLMLGGVIATIAIMIRKELLIPIFCGIFLVENVSVVIQTTVFKYYKRKYGREYAENNRFFKMAPLHHHYQKLNYHESKITTRFWIVSIMLAVLAIVTLKIR